MTNFIRLIIKLKDRQAKKFMKMYNFKNIKKLGYDPEAKFLVEQERTMEDIMKLILPEDLMYAESESYYMIDYVHPTMYNIINKKWHKQIKAAQEFAAAYDNRKIDYLRVNRDKEGWVARYLRSKGFHWYYEEFNEQQLAKFIIMPQNLAEYTEEKNKAIKWYDYENRKVIAQEQVLLVTTHNRKLVSKFTNEADSRFDVNREIMIGGVTLEVGPTGSYIRNIDGDIFLECKIIPSTELKQYDIENSAQLDMILAQYGCDISDFTIYIWK